MTEDFYDLIMGTPEAERVGKVFKLDGTFTGTAITPLRVCRTVSEIGKAAGVVVAMVEKRKRIDGKLTTTTGKKFASAHDLRRAFGTRWAKRLMPAVLKRLMRHSDVATTMTYYVTIDADAVADAVWGRNWEAGNTLGNNRPTKATATERGQADESTEAIAAFQVTSAVSATARFPTPCPAADRTAAWAAWCGPAVPDEAHPAESGARGGGGTWHRPLPQVSDGRWGPWGRGYLGGRPPKLPKPAQTIAQVNGRRKWGPWGRVVS